MKHIDDIVSRMKANAYIPLHAGGKPVDHDRVKGSAALFEAAADHLRSKPRSDISRTLESMAIHSADMRVWLNHHADRNIPRSLEIHVRQPADAPPRIVSLQQGDAIGFGDLPGLAAFHLAEGACRAAALSLRSLLDPANAAEADRRLGLVHKIVGALAIETAEAAGAKATKARSTLDDPARLARATVEYDGRSYSDATIDLGTLIDGLTVRTATWSDDTTSFSPMAIVLTRSQLSPSPVQEIEMVRALARRRARP